MASASEQTIAINKFQGIDRYEEGSIDDPNKFKTLANWNIPKMGVIESLPGSSDFLPNSVLEGRKIYHANFLERLDGEKFLVVAADADSDFSNSSNLINAAQFATLGSTPIAHNTFVMYRGLGRTLYRSNLGNLSYGTNTTTSGLTFTIPTLTSMHKDCVEILIYSRPPGGFGSEVSSNGAYILVCSLTRDDDGNFPTGSVSIPYPQCRALATVAVEQTPTAFSVQTTAASGTNLKAGRVYYVAIAPWMCNSQVWNSGSTNHRLPRARCVWDGASTPEIIMSFTVPKDGDSITLDFTGMTGTINGNVINRYLVYVGETPEDLMLVGHNSKVGLPILATSSGTVLQCKIINIPSNSSMRPQFTDLDYHPMTNQTYTLNAFNGRASGVCLGLIVSSGVGGSQGVTDYGTGFEPRKRVAWFSIQSRTGFVRHLFTSPYHRGATLIDQTLYVDADSGIGGFDSFVIYRNFFATTKLADPDALNPAVCYRPQSVSMYSRLYVVDGQMQMFYTNGKTMSVVCTDYQTYKAPIAKTLTLFQERLVIGGGLDLPPVYQNQFSQTAQYPNMVAYSQANNPFSWTATPGVTPSQNQLFVNATEGSDVVGFGVVSETLASSGPSSFLVIGKSNSILSWNGTTTSGAQTLTTITGFMSRESFGLTRAGGIFVGKDGNVYSLKGISNPIPMGYEVQSILDAIPESYKPYLNAVRVRDNLVIAYPTEDENLTRQIHLEVRTLDEGTMRLYEGPHDMHNILGHNFISSFDDIADFHVAFDSSGGRLILLNDASTFTALGAPAVEKVIEIDRLGFGENTTLKRINRIFLDVEIETDETFTFTIEGTDATQPIVSFSKTAQYINGSRQILQAFVPSRSLGRINLVRITSESLNKVKIYEIDLLISGVRRRFFR
jgi:hypothetical protein